MCVRVCACVKQWRRCDRTTSLGQVCAFVYVCVFVRVCASVCVCVHVCARMCVREAVATV